MYPEVVINCDDIKIHVKNGKLLSITVGNTQPFDFQYIVNSYNRFLEARSYDEECFYHEEWAKASKEFRNLMKVFKRYNNEHKNPLMHCICELLDERNTDEFISFLNNDFFES